MVKLNTNIKLIILPIVIIISMIVLSFIFSQKIQLLKKEIDLIYFGNFVPNHKLNLIKKDYLKIIHSGKITSAEKKNILKNWEYYYNQYKTEEEKAVLKKINKQLRYALSKNAKSGFLQTLKEIDYLIKHEVDSAYLQRKQFLVKYQKMEDFLFYSQVTIIVLVLFLTIYVTYQAIKQNKHLAYLNEQYKIEANTDGLTNLYNRKYFDTVFGDLTAISYENNFKSAFVMIDIDFFKQYNDTYGHDAGDIALKKVAYVLDSCLDKDYEYSFRLGGEEFGIIIFNTNLKYVQYTLNNIRHELHKLQIPHTASKTGVLTLSMGVLMVDESSYKLSTKELYNIADKKLYHSKENGRDQYTI